MSTVIACCGRHSSGLFYAYNFCQLLQLIFHKEYRKALVNFRLLCVPFALYKQNADIPAVCLSVYPSVYFNSNEPERILMKCDVDFISL